MAIRDWPEEERPREKLIQLGPQSLSDAELLALFLRTGRPGITAVDAGRELIQHFGGLSGILGATLEDFIGFRGMGPARYASLQAAVELGRRHLQENLKREGVLQNPDDTKRFLSLWLRQRLQEVFVCLFLDNQHRIIASEELFHGTINNASVHPREVVRRALRHNAAAVILAHNHPSGTAEPSLSDRQITQTLKQALELIDVRVLDHIIIGGNCSTSLAQLGWI